LQRNNLPIENFQTMLDFGCGCGRVIRNWRSLQGVNIYGSDYNHELIAWCDENLSFAHFDSNDLAPPLSYESNKFDLIYALSVFTHLPEELQLTWLQELTRVLQPGGYLLKFVWRDILNALFPQEGRPLRLFLAGSGKACAEKVILQSKRGVALFEGGHAGLLQLGSG
jgi:ubiquinone/menaquinone biosynthesis C-methylase UbiE